MTDFEQSREAHGRLVGERPFFRRLAGIPGGGGGAPEGRALERSLRAGRTLVRIEILGTPEAVHDGRASNTR